MRTRLLRVTGCVLAIVLITSVLAVAGDFTTVKLPKPKMEGGKPLMEALKARQTQREFSAEQLPMRVLSNMLWAAFGINRAESGKRTAPSAIKA